MNLLNLFILVGAQIDISGLEILSPSYAYTTVLIDHAKMCGVP